jgi:Protein of unknown function (DUF2934)
MPLTHEMRERVLRNDTVRAWISKRAYELYQLRACEHGKAIEDWTNAESELLALASLLEEIFRLESTPRQALKERQEAKTPPKSQRRRTRSASALSSELPPITDKKLDEEKKTTMRQASGTRVLSTESEPSFRPWRLSPRPAPLES